jgi:hypothetical protein
LSDHRPWATALVGLLLGVFVSRMMSVEYAVWDRQWHIPLLTSMRGERAPFWNVYEPNGRLFYHYSGDALAAALQTLSFAHIHASNALSRTHDVMFGLIGLFVALVLPSFGQRGAVPTIAVILATLLGGPATAFREGEARPQMGQSITNLLTLSFRPHYSLSYFLILGFVVAALLPIVTDEKISPAITRPCLFAITALMTLTDEASLGTLGILLGTLWLLCPRAVAPTRLRGALVLLALAASIAATMLALGGTFGPGAHRQILKWVPWQIPGFYQPSVPLSEHHGRVLLGLDFLSIFGALAVGLVVVAASRKKAVIVTFIAYAAIAVASLVCLTRLTINGGGLECHRFVVSALVQSPFFVFYWLAALRAQPQAAWARPVAAATALVAFAPAVVSTLEWWRGPAPHALESSKGFWGNDNFYTTDCVVRADAKLRDAVRPTYVAQDLWYLYAGCRPLFAPGPEPGHGQDNHELLIGWPELGIRGLARLDKWLNREDILAVYCAPGASGHDDAVCDAARRANGCRRATSSLDACTLDARTRRALLSGI